MEINTIVSSVLVFIGGVIGYFFKYFLDKKSELVSEANKIKRESYKKFVDMIIDLFRKSKRFGDQRVPVKTMEEFYKVQNELADRVDEFYKEYLLYASPEVVNSYGEYMQSIYKSDPKIPDSDLREQIRFLSKMIKAMRKDLGLSNYGLGKDGLKVWRAKMPEFDEFFN